MAVAFLPWQQRDVEIRVNEPIPMTFQRRAELQRDISEAKSGEFSLRGYDVHKATPFGDGVLVGAVGAVVAVVSSFVLISQRQLKPALLMIVGGALAALAVGFYDAFTKGVLNDWSSRDWYIVWGQDSVARMQTQTADGLFIMLVVAAYLVWRSVSMLKALGKLGPSGRGSNLRSSVPNPGA